MSGDLGHIGRFAKAEDGTILVFWGLSLGVLLGIVAMSFDLGRTGITRTELQAFADNVALSAAGELDGGADALTRAAAAAALISDRQTFGAADPALSGEADYTLTFYADLPASDTSALTGATTDPAKAAYVRATVTPTTVPSTFGAAFTALTGAGHHDESATASAVAGFTLLACDVTPLMFCLPDADFKAKENIGKMIRLRSGGNGAAWGPGDFGFLDPGKISVDDEGACAGLTGVQLDACLMGAVSGITQCFSQRGVDIEPGQKVGIEDAIFNVRFDIYKSIMNGKRNDPDFAPAPNVIKGIVPNGGGECIGGTADISPDTVALPRDDCFAAGTCTRYGNGVWSSGRTGYVGANYAGDDPYPAALTRYQYYMSEIAGAAGGDILSGLSETGLPSCSHAAPAGPDRRVIIIAGVDCAANEIKGAATGIPVKEFVKVFLTEPVGQDGSSPPQLDIWGEVIGSASNGGTGATGVGGIVRDVVQLYR